MRFIISEAPDNSKLGEESQVSDITFALCSLEDPIRPITPFVRCRDFLCDAISGMMFDQSVGNIYGFTHDHTDKPRGDIAVLAINTANIECIRDNITIINKMEIQAGIQPSQIFDTQEAETYLIFLDKRWAENPVHMSLITLLFRIATYAKGNTTLEEMLKSSWEGEEKILKSVTPEIIRLYFANLHKVTKAVKIGFNESDLAFDLMFTDYIHKVHTGTGIMAVADALNDKVDTKHMPFLSYTAKMLMEARSVESTSQKVFVCSTPENRKDGLAGFVSAALGA